MKSLWKILLLAMVAMTVIMAGCSKDDKEGGIVTDPASGAGLTDNNGVASFTVGSVDVNATVTDDSDTPLPGIAVNAYLLPDHLMLMAIDSSDGYYPSISVTSLATVAGMPSNPSNDRVNSPQGVQRAAVDVDIILYGSQVAAFGFNPDIANFSQIFSSGWTTETCGDYLLSDIYNIADTTEETFNECIFVHLDDDVKTATGSEYGTVVFLSSGLGDFSTFAALAGYTLRLFQGDSLHACYTSYGEIGLPIFNIESAILNRNFWCQFTLIWGEFPEDLDSHLWTPAIEGDSFHVYFGDPGSSTLPPYADLDVDDVTSYGPEHVTIYNEFTGTYTYAVYDWSGDGLISTSGAVVSLIKPDGDIQTFEVPTGASEPNWWWHVCTIDGTTGEVTVINQLSAEPPLSYFAPADAGKKATSK